MKSSHSTLWFSSCGVFNRRIHWKTPKETSSAAHLSYKYQPLTSDLESSDLRRQQQQVVLQEGRDLLQRELGEQRRVGELHKVVQDEASGGVAHRQQAVGGGDVPDVDARLDVELGQQEVHAHLEELRDLQGGGGRRRAADGVEGHVDAAQVGEGDDVGETWRRAGGREREREMRVLLSMKNGSVLENKNRRNTTESYTAD